MKNFLSVITFSLPLIIIFTERKTLRQNPAQWPINFPPSKVIFLGKSKAGRNISEITIIPKKKNVENNKFLIILSKAKISLCAFVYF